MSILCKREEIGVAGSGQIRQQLWNWARPLDWRMLIRTGKWCDLRVENDRSGWTAEGEGGGREVAGGCWTKVGVMKLVDIAHLLNTLWNRVGRIHLGKACDL